MGQANFRKNRIIELEAEVARLRADKARFDWLDATDYEGAPRITTIVSKWWNSADGTTVRQALDVAMEDPKP